MAYDLLQAVRGLRLSDPELGAWLAVRSLLAKRRQQQPERHNSPHPCPGGRSHIWSTGQDQCAVLKRQLQLLLPGIMYAARVE